MYDRIELLEGCYIEKKVLYCYKELALPEILNTEMAGVGRTRVKGVFGNGMSASSLSSGRG